MTKAWPVVRLGDVACPITRPLTPRAGTLYRQIGVRLWGEGAYEREPLDGAQTKYAQLFRAEAGDIIVNKIWARNGSVAVVQDVLAGCFGSGEFPMFVPDRMRLDPRWVHWLTKTHAFWAQCDQKSQGTSGKNRIKPERFLQIEIPLPPLTEQRRVVARIEELAGQIHDVAELRRQADLEASSLVAAARNACIGSLRLRYHDVQLGDVCTKITDGPHVSPRYVDRGVPFISVRNISETGINFSSAKFITSEDHIEYSKKALVQRGDVLYTKGGTTGVARRVDTDEPFSIWVHVALLKLRRDHACCDFVEHMLNAPSCKEQAERATRGSTNRDLGLSRMSRIAFPLPPLAEQWRIASALDVVQDQVILVNRNQVQVAAELDALLPAILDRAFKGELV